MKRPSDFRLAVLDRDGTINRDSPDFIKSADEWEALPGALAAIARLSQTGWTVCVASNQSGIGRGLFTIVDLHAINEKMRRELESHGGHIAGFYFCPHKPDDRCDCRKPKPGLLEQVAKRYDVDMQGVPVIGDSARDVQAALAIGARPILVCTGNGRKTSGRYLKSKDVEVYDDLAAVAAVLLAEGGLDYS